MSPEKPQNVKNCSIEKENHEMIHVQCIKGDDGGLAQHFVMEVYYENQDILVRNISALHSPEFRVQSLPAETTYMLIIYAVNQRGKSPPAGLVAKTSSGMYAYM